MDSLYAIIRGCLRQALNDIRLPQKGLVTSYDPLTHKAKVMLKPQEIETGWLQVATIGAGAGFGITYGLKAGDEVTVTFERGNIDGGLVSASHFNGQDSPVKTNGHEFKIVHESGSHLKFFANGDIEIHAEGKLKVMSQGSLLVSSPDSVTLNEGNLSVLSNNFNINPLSGSGVYNGALHVDEPD